MTYNNYDYHEPAELYRRVRNDGGTRYVPLSDTEFAEKFTGDGRIFITKYENGKCVGFASGTLCEADGYLSFIAVDDRFRGRGIGSELLAALEEKIFGGGAKQIDISFRNPVNMEWFIPRADGDNHPCAPGVNVVSEAYIFLKNRGYRDYAKQNAYYRRIDNYTEPSQIAETRERLAGEGIELTLYNASLHHGLPELFDDIGNAGWKNYVLSHLGSPVIVTVDNNREGLVVAYTGPLTSTPGGRGAFCGIGTLKEYRGRGIGSVVFSDMCTRHRDAGAGFMSLYTGETNNARNIYENAGFRIVGSFANIRKKVRVY